MSGLSLPMDNSTSTPSSEKFLDRLTEDDTKSEISTVICSSYSFAHNVRGENPCSNRCTFTNSKQTFSSKRKAQEGKWQMIDWCGEGFATEVPHR